MHKAAFEGHPDCLFVVRRDGTIVAVNERAAALLGYSSGELVGRPLRSYFNRHGESLSVPSADKPIEKETTYIVYLVPKTGPIDATEGTLRVNPITAKLALAQWQSTVSSATHTALLGERHRYRSLFEQWHDAVFFIDLDGNHIEVNQRAADLLGYSITELEELSPRSVTAEPDKSAEVLRHLLAGEHVPPYERLFRRKDGSLIPVEVNVEVVRDGTGKPLYIQSLARDITRRRAAQERIDELLSQKEVLLREINHRAKNSMTSAIHMIGAEIAETESQAVHDALTNVERRLRSAELVYDALVASEDHMTVRLDEYLDNLVDRIAESHAGGDVRIEQSLSPVTVHSKRAFPVGAAVNEMITNALKHAFPQGRGTISVRLVTGEESHAILTVSDDGVGAAPDAKSGYGTLIIESLIEQIGGSVTRTTNAGTTLRLTIPLHEDTPEDPPHRDQSARAE
jgi:PAS domain S-box-containing protein